MGKKEGVDNILHGDYKRRSSKSFLTIGVLLIIGAVLFYPTFQGYLSADAPILTLQVIIPWVLCGLAFIVILSAIPVMFRKYARHKEAEILRAKEQAELLVKYHAELDATNPLTDPADFLTPPKKGEQFPTYRPPLNPDNDPYSAKPKGFAAEQARLGYPQDPAQKTLVHPEDPLYSTSLQEQFEMKDN